MDLMSIKDIKDIIKYYKKVYPNCYRDIIVMIGSKYIKIKTERGHRYLNLKDFENIIEEYDDLLDDSISITIHGYPILNKHDFLDATLINIHCPINNIDIISNNNNIKSISKDVK